MKLLTALWLSFLLLVVAIVWGRTQPDYFGEPDYLWEEVLEEERCY